MVREIRKREWWGSEKVSGNLLFDLNNWKFWLFLFKRENLFYSSSEIFALSYTEVSGFTNFLHSSTFRDFNIF